MPDSRLPRCLAPHPLVPAITCGLTVRHDGDHAGAAYWTQAGDADEAPTMRLPPVRDRVGILRRPPAPVVQELRERTELLAALVEELAAYDDEEPGE